MPVVLMLSGALVLLLLIIAKITAPELLGGFHGQKFPVHLVFSFVWAYIFLIGAAEFVGLNIGQTSPGRILIILTTAYLGLFTFLGLAIDWRAWSVSAILFLLILGGGLFLFWWEVFSRKRSGTKSRRVHRR